MKRSFLIVGCLVTFAAAAPHAQARGRIVSVQGAYGGGYLKHRSIDRSGGSVTASRGLRTNGGYGYSASHSASRQSGSTSTSGSVATNNGRSASTASGRAWGDGSYSGGRTTTLSDGRSFGHSANAMRNDDGSVSWSASRTRLDGTTATAEGSSLPQ